MEYRNRGRIYLVEFSPKSISAAEALISSLISILKPNKTIGILLKWIAVQLYQCVYVENVLRGLEYVQDPYARVWGFYFFDMRGKCRAHLLMFFALLGQTKRCWSFFVMRLLG